MGAEVPFRKGEPCLKPFRGNQSPKNYTLAFLLYHFVWPNVTSVNPHCSMTPEHRYKSAQLEGKLRPFISSFITGALQILKSGLLKAKPFHVRKLFIHFIRIVRRSVEMISEFIFIHLSSTRIMSWVTFSHKVTNNVFCVLCLLFSSKTQDVHTDYFACIAVCVQTVRFHMSKERVILQLRFFLDSALSPYFLSYGIVYPACLLVEMNESEVTLHGHAKITVTRLQNRLQY